MAEKPAGQPYKKQSVTEQGTSVGLCRAMLELGPLGIGLGTLAYYIATGAIIDEGKCTLPEPCSDCLIGKKAITLGIK